MSLRFDRLASLYLIAPLRQQLRIGRPRIPILMYHSVSETSEMEKRPYYRTVTTPRVFAQHMAHLRENGYRTVSPTEAADRLEHGISSTSSKVAVITFDDGFADFYKNAFPVLKQFGFTATVYLPTAFVNDERTSFRRKECMTWAEIRELQNFGISFGSHTVTHPQLYGLGDKAVRREVEASKQTIEKHLDRSVTSFAYPFAFPQADPKFKESLREILIRAGYSNGVCTSIGTLQSGDDRFFMKRLPVNGCDDVALFDAKLTGAYDWLYQFQYLSKLAKSSKLAKRWSRLRKVQAIRSFES